MPTEPAQARWEQFKVLGDNDLDSTYGGTHKVDLPEGEYIYALQQLVNLGSLSGGTSPSYNAGAEYDLFDRIQVLLNGTEYFDVTGQMLHFLNAYQSGVVSDTPLEYGFGHRRGGSLVGAIPVSSFTSAKVKYDLDDLGDITSGSPTSQSGTEIKSSALQAPAGRFGRLRTYQYYQENIGATGEHRIDINEFGRLTGMVINENTATVDNVQLVTKNEQGKKTLVDLDFDEIRARNEREAAASSLPSGWVWLPIKQAPAFANQKVVRAILDTSATGTVEFYPRIDGQVQA